MQKVEESPGREQKCSNCMFWEMVQENLDAQTDSLGECHRFPPSYPRVITENDGDKTIDICGSFPWTIAIDWCGEFKEAEVAQ